ncbi:hypothetical protein [Neobacillus dielmonensis]|uniref:hypothetical protein n=1 Tax=Neobacillus dielmonensis TaxID=1347369 RepID=UPI0005A850C5|nr:hypothetical protein [Neobacillus dielmonensis]
MVATNLPTKSDYENAVDELRKLNDELFYDDFKEKIKHLENNIVQLSISNSADFKQEAENVISKAGLLFQQMDTLKTEIEDLLQKNIALFNENAKELQQAFMISNQELLDKATDSIGAVTETVNDFMHKLTEVDEKNQQFLQQNETFVSMTKQQLSLAEEKINTHIADLRTMENRLEELKRAYEEMFQKHTESIKSIMVVREEALVDKLTHQMDNWTAAHVHFNENLKRDFEEWQHQIDTFFKEQSKQNSDRLQTVVENMVSKEDVAKIDKKSKVLLTIVAVEAILIAISFFV